MKNKISFLFFLFLIFFLLFFLKKEIKAFPCGPDKCSVCDNQYHPGSNCMCTDCGGSGGGGSSQYDNPPQGYLDVLNCNEMAGWACDASCTGNNPPCATTINVFDKVIPWRLKGKNDLTIRVGIGNCTSCDWGQTGNFSAVYCGRCPGECSSLKCDYAWAHKLVSTFTSDNVNRPDLARVDACRGTTQHGFSVRTPSSVIDGTTHYLTFIAINQGTGFNVSINDNIPRALTCQKPTCSLSLNKNSASSDQSNSIAITFSGKAYNKDIRLWIRRADLRAVSQLEKAAIYTHHSTNPDRYYYQMKTCNPGNYAGCTTTYTLPNNLPLGDYVVHCDTDSTAGGRCSGSTMCSYYGGPINCEDWRPCSENDHATFKIANPSSLSTLRIDAAKNDPQNSTSIGAIRGLSGLKKKTGVNDDPSVDGITINGSSYYNYLLIGQEVNPNGVTDASNIGISGVIFGSTSMPTSISNFSQITSNVSTNQGFILLYANKNYTAAQSPIGIATTADKYYVYAPNANGIYNWHEIQGQINYDYTSSRIKIIPQKPEECNKRDFSGKNTYSDRAQLPCFKVYLYRNLTNSNFKTWGTYGYLYDDLNHTIQAKPAQKIPD